MNIKKALRAGAASLALAAVATTGLVTPAQAIGSDLRGDQISWYSHIPCSDGGSVSYSADWKFTGAPSGYYKTRLALYTTSGVRLALGPLQYWTVPSNNSTLLASSWAGSVAYAGEAEMTGFVWRWNGSDYVLYARETIPCW